ncbi:MAG: TonB-dependent receptor [Pseudomonadales bacterium]
MRIHSLVILALILSGSVFSLKSYAAEKNLVIEEILVTARKREESAQDVPIAMTALTTEITDASVRDITDMNAYLPNVIIEDSSARSRSSAINIRGLSYTESDKSFDPAVAVALDGVFIGTSSGQVIENFDLERVEVLRGPQGTLFGKNTVGGVINAIRTRPTGELGGKLQLTGGKWGQQEIRGVLNLPRVGEMLSTKLFYTQIKNDGFQKNTFLGSDGPEKDYTNFGAAFLFETESFEALLTVETYDDSSDIGVARNANDPGFYVCDVLGDCRSDNRGDTDFRTETNNPAQYDTDAVTLTMKYDINEQLQLVSVTGWRDEVEDYFSDLDGSSFEYLGIDNDNLHEQKSTELRLEGVYEKFDFVLGAILWENEYEQNWITFGSFWDSVVPGLSTNAPVAPGLGLTDLCLLELVGALRCYQGVGIGSAGLGPNFTQNLHQNQVVNSEAMFLQGNYRVSEKWTVTAGIRYTREEKDFFAAQSYLVPLAQARLPVEQWAIDAAGNPDVFNGSTEWKEWTPKLGVDYRLNDDIMFYASYSEGFHSGGYFGRNQNAQDFANTYEPEFAESWEVGMKAQFFDNRVQVNAAAFYNDFEGKQEATVKLDSSTNTVVTVIDNVGSVDYTGFEVEARWLINENFNVFATLGLLDAEYTDFCIDLDGTTAGAGQTSDCGTVISAGFDIAGNELFIAPQNEESLDPKFAPDMTYGLGGTYTIPVGAGRIDIHARYNYVGNQETALDNAPGTELDSADFIHASVTYEVDRYRVTLFGRNLTDEVRETVLDIAAFTRRSYVEPGRSWGLEFAMEF